jgi:hypothetical protein
VPSLSVTAILGEAADVYRLLFRRSFPIALVIYVLIAAVEIAAGTVDGRTARIVVGVVEFVLSVAGPLLVQGALVKIVRSVHQGTRVESAFSLLLDAGRRLGSLLGASLIYFVGVVFGLLLLVVPGLLVAARWALMAPAIMLEGRWAFAARERSRRIMRGEITNGLGDRTWLALGVVLVSFVLTIGVSSVAVAFTDDWSWGWPWGAWIVLNALAAPFQAHALSVLYYRLVDPDRPVIDPRVSSWPSVWEGPVTA